MIHGPESHVQIEQRRSAAVRVNVVAGHRLLEQDFFRFWRKDVAEDVDLFAASFLRRHGFRPLEVVSQGVHEAARAFRSFAPAALRDRRRSYSLPRLLFHAVSPARKGSRFYSCFSISGRAIVLGRGSFFFAPSLEKGQQPFRLELADRFKDGLLALKGADLDAIPGLFRGHVSGNDLHVLFPSTQVGTDTRWPAWASRRFRQKV